MRIRNGIAEMSKPANAGARIKRLVAFLVFALLVLRAGPFLAAPRFWAEEGRFYFETARHGGAAAMLVYTLNGYYAGVENLAALTASFVPLARAPLVTMLAALFIHMALCAGLLLNAAGLGIRHPALLFLLGLSAIALPPNHEVWLTTNGAHFYLCALCGAVLCAAANAPRPLTRRLNRAATLLGGLSGVPSGLLLPLFLWRAWRERDRERACQAALLAVGVAVQLLCLGLAWMHREASFADRNGPPSYAILLTAMLVNFLFYPLSGAAWLMEDSRALLAAMASGRAQWLGGLALILAAAPLLWGRFASSASRYGVAAALTLAVCGVSLARGVHADLVLPEIGGRYFLAPVLLFYMAALAGVQQALDARTLIPRALAAAAALYFGYALVMFYFLPNRLQHGPDYAVQLRLWQAGAQDHITIWPGEPWELRP